MYVLMIMCCHHVLSFVLIITEHCFHQLIFYAVKYHIFEGEMLQIELLQLFNGKVLKT